MKILQIERNVLWSNFYFLHYSKRILLVFNKTTQILQSSISLQIGGAETKHFVWTLNRNSGQLSDGSLTTWCWSFLSLLTIAAGGARRKYYLLETGERIHQIEDSLPALLATSKVKAFNFLWKFGINKGEWIWLDTRLVMVISWNVCAGQTAAFRDY